MNIVKESLALIESLPAIIIDHWIILTGVGFIILYLYKKKIKRISRKIIKLMYLVQGTIISLGILRDILQMLL